MKTTWWESKLKGGIILKRRDMWADKAPKVTPRQTPTATATENRAHRRTQRHAHVAQSTGRRFFTRLTLDDNTGRREVLELADIKASNPVVQELMSQVAAGPAALDTSTIKRFWRPRILEEGEDIPYCNDEELLKTVSHIGYKGEDPVRVARLLGLIAEYFFVSEDGEPLKDLNGDWIPAPAPADATPEYTPEPPAIPTAPAE